MTEDRKKTEKDSATAFDFSGAMSGEDAALVRTLGAQVTFWGFGCDPVAADDPELIDREMTRYVESNGLTLKDRLVSRFQPQGLTLVLVLEESHLLVNTWPEHGVIQVEIFSCKAIETRSMSAIFSDAFKSSRTYMHELK